MDNQLYICSELKNFQFDKVQSLIQDVNERRSGGLWTSSYIPGKGSNWMLGPKFVREFVEYNKGYLFKVKSKANILHIKCYEDEEYFKKFYNSSPANVAKEFDALHLDIDYIEMIKAKFEQSFFLSWSTESTWWFNVNNLELLKVFDGRELKNMLIKN
ncbi:hypothetical protein [Bacillus halotolerans]|uniref:hypothetical protein n=1 Tax=Bacillus halotolerans TaxID=260554 RepID=UPI002DB98A01|nr:hypothetical protein [Bacillus halotolerans]MEC0251766.1 hypothetical protein [Bacillus halotolerans]MEC0359002.1 hypothetical protein [Bacillus halotolerans]